MCLKTGWAHGNLFSKCEHKRMTGENMKRDRDRDVVAQTKECDHEFIFDISLSMVVSMSSLLLSELVKTWVARAPSCCPQRLEECFHMERNPYMCC